MRYPTVTLSDAKTYILGRRSGAIESLEQPRVSFQGEGDDCVDELDAILGTVLSEWKSIRKGAKPGQERDAVEGRLSETLYLGLKRLPPGVLTDRDFWRYLAAAHLYDFVSWRDGAECELASFGAGGDNPGWDCVPLRMFNRALISEEGGTTEDPFWGARVAGTDLWRAHILRVLNGNAPRFVHEMLIEVERGNLKTNIVREFAVGVKRIRANMMFELLDEYQAKELILAEEARARSVLDEASATD